MFRDITPGRFQQLHNAAFQDDEHIESSVALVGTEPLSALWEFLDLPGESVLEIGPGSGHLLAAAQKAGHSVEAVESSAVHRDYILGTWGISALHPTMDAIPAGRIFSTIIAINVFEHIYDIGDFLHGVRERLAPGGTFFLSTPNAASLEAAVLGTWWPMCKVHDHVSFPSPGGVAAAARASGLRAERIWSTGLPFEFPITALTAARDRVRWQRGGGAVKTGDHDRARSAAVSTSGNENINPRVKTALARFYRVAAPFDPVYRVLAALGRAGSLKARLTR